MRANPEVLILEDDPAQLASLRQHLGRMGFHPLASRSASGALTALRNNLASSRPVLAIIDWDLRKAPDQTASSSDVLSLLARDATDCLALVYSANIDSFAVRGGVHRAHPRAWLHDKREGDDSLLARVDQLLERRIADIRVRGGTVVVHVPTGAQHHHREAVRLVVHYPEIVTLQSDTATKAVRRFGSWLIERDSAVRVVSHGNRNYRLSVVP